MTPKLAVGLELSCGSVRVDMWIRGCIFGEWAGRGGAAASICEAGASLLRGRDSGVDMWSAGCIVSGWHWVWAAEARKDAGLHRGLDRSNLRQPAARVYIDAEQVDRLRQHPGSVPPPRVADLQRVVRVDEHSAAGT